MSASSSREPVTSGAIERVVIAEPTFYRHCLICGKRIETPWGPEVHTESAFALRAHVGEHSVADLASYALREALRGI